MLISLPLLFLKITTGKVINVADGDTITSLDSSKEHHKIHTYGIDYPEKGHPPFGKTEKKLTGRLTYKKTATVTEYDTDKYGSTIGVVEVDGVNVNEEIILAGYARLHSAMIGCGRKERPGDRRSAYGRTQTQYHPGSGVKGHGTAIIAVQIHFLWPTEYIMETSNHTCSTPRTVATIIVKIA